MAREILGEASKGNLLPLMRFMSIAPIIGIATGLTRNVLKGRDPWAFIKEDDDATWEVVAEGYENVGAFGMLQDISFLTETAGSRKYPAYLAGTVGGPTTGTAVETLLNTTEAIEGDLEPLGRQGVKAIPAVGPFAASKIFPYTPPASVTAEQKQASGVDMSELSDDEFLALQEEDFDFNKWVDSLSEETKEIVTDERGKVYSNKELERLATRGPEYKEIIEGFMANRKRFNRLDNYTDNSDIGADENMILKYYDLTDEGIPEQRAAVPAAQRLTPKINEAWGIEEFQFEPNNKTAQEWAKHQEWLAANPNASEVKIADKLKNNKSHALKAQFPTEITDYYGQTNATIENAGLTSEQLGQLFFYDDLRVLMGLIQKPRYSTSFRSDFGYGSLIPSDGKGKKSGARLRAPNISSFASDLKGIKIGTTPKFKTANLKSRLPRTAIPKATSTKPKIRIER